MLSWWHLLCDSGEVVWNVTFSVQMWLWQVEPRAAGKVVWTPWK